jgi:hypothetical protein
MTLRELKEALLKTQAEVLRLKERIEKLEKELQK